MKQQQSPVPLDSEPRGIQRVANLVASIRPSTATLVAGCGILVFVILGTLQRTLYPDWRAANLDSEASVATVFAAVLLWAAAISWILVALIDRPRRWYMAGWSALLVLMALDEANAFHEALERRMEVDWQILYLPILLLGGVMWWRVVMRWVPSRIASLLLAGAGTWAVTLILELVQNWGGPPVRASIYDPTMIAEEGLEMIGSTLIFTAGLFALRALPDVGPPMTDRY
ncbi:MAG: hypothetical protein GY720_14340 [bacterium]|nr:hypothetical protein [bacterium]